MFKPLVICNNQYIKFTYYNTATGFWPTVIIPVIRWILLEYLKSIIPATDPNNSYPIAALAVALTAKVRGLRFLHVDSTMNRN